jgi:hypothetical protein
MITMGPFLPTSMSLTERFETHLHTAIPDHFRGAKPYHVERDPVISRNLEQEWYISPWVNLTRPLVKVP